MIENLRLAGSKTLTPSDSDVSSNWTLPAKRSDFQQSCTNTAYHISSGNTSYGNYYNWYAATAGTGTCAMTFGEATSSICPKGWKLPAGGSNGQFQSLYGQYSSSTAMRSSPASFVLSGFRNGEESRNQGSIGYLRTSTAYSAALSYGLRLSSSDVDPINSNLGKYNGFPVRCVAR